LRKISTSECALAAPRLHPEPNPRLLPAEITAASGRIDLAMAMLSSLEL
jgi:hypothetical protein